MALRTRRALFFLTVFLAACGALGSFINQKVAAQSASDESVLRDNLRSFTNAYAVVEQNYAEPLTQDMIDQIIYGDATHNGAIPGMLHVLDPHSNFYDPKAYAQMREDQHGHYYGVGMTILEMPDASAKNGRKIVVRSLFEGTPSYKAGIRPGDVILAVGGKSTEGMESAAVAALLKGPRNTHVMVEMQREGSPKPLYFDLVRDDIPQLSVDMAFMIRPGIAYMHIKNFIETTGREVSDALDSFGDIQGLVIDLRGNPGGLLNEAVGVSDKFLKKGQIVVSQRGRAFPDQVYRATHGSDTKYPIVVLVNRSTASAAEIVSGALQDHDRALIVGETTFGKGLVQTVFQTSEDTGLALTTYHYYTPSGRLIQRNYDHVSLYDYFMVRDSDTQTKDKANLEVKLTDSGRTVYGGGGITPDEKIDSPKATRLQQELYGNLAFFNFSKHYFAVHSSISRDFVVDDKVLREFKDFLKQQTPAIDYTDAEFTAVQDWIKTSIKKELFTSQFGELAGLKVVAEWDPQIAKAVSFLPEAQTLEEHLKLAEARKSAVNNN